MDPGLGRSFRARANVAAMADPQGTDRKGNTVGNEKSKAEALLFLFQPPADEGIALMNGMSSKLIQP